MGEYNYLQDIMDSVYGSQYWDQMAGDFYQPGPGPEEDERLLDLIRGESRRGALPGGNARTSQGLTNALQPAGGIPNAPDMTAMESGRNNQAFQDKLNGLDPAYPSASAPAPTLTNHKVQGTAADIAAYNQVLKEYGAEFDENGGSYLSEEAYAKALADPRLNVSYAQPAAAAAPVAAPVAAKPKTPTLGAAAPVAAKPAAKPSTTPSSGISLATPKKMTVNKPNAQSGGIKF